MAILSQHPKGRFDVKWKFLCILKMLTLLISEPMGLAKLRMAKKFYN